VSILARQGVSVSRRALSRAELKRGAALALGLAGSFEFDKLKAPWQLRRCGKGPDEEDEENEEECKMGRSTRFSIADIQKLGCPANSEPVFKLMKFHEKMGALSWNLKLKLAAPKLASSCDSC
jgi:hypothetical protein